MIEKEPRKIDFICCVLANNRSKKIICEVLNHFIPDYKKLEASFTSPNDDPFYEFENEEEIINYFCENKSEDTSLLWNKNQNNPDKIMVGAFFTSDGMLIMSLTFDPLVKTEQEYLEELKKLLNSEIGVITSTNPPEFENGKDFIEKYS